jgi:hypothetical protein
MYQLIENDVRLLRRILVAYNLNDFESAWIVTKHLRDKGLNFLLPKEQTEKQYLNYRARLTINEKWLADKYGAIILPDYNDIIFLNSKWIIPYTLYVRLVEEVPELGELGQVHWVAFATPTDFRPRAERMHYEYQRLRNPSTHGWFEMESPPEMIEPEIEPEEDSVWTKFKKFVKGLINAKR